MMSSGFARVVVGALLGLSCSAQAQGCAELFAQLASGFSMEIATSSARDAGEAAHWALAYGTWNNLASKSLDPLLVGKEDALIGAMLGEPLDFPKGTAACGALAARLERSGFWSAKEMGEARQQAVNDLAKIDWDISTQEVRHMSARMEWRKEARKAIEQADGGKP